MTECVNISSLDNGDNEAAVGGTLKSLINQVFLPVVCVFGAVGNLLNLAILTRRKLQRSFRTLEQSANLCLVALAVSDLMLCICAFLTVFMPSDNIYHSSGFWLLYGKFHAAVINIFIMESTLLTVAMSLERFLAICFPLRQDIYLTTCRIKFVIVLTFIFSVIFNIPVLWRFQEVALCSDNFRDPTLTFNSSLTLKDVTSLVPNLTPETQSHTVLDIGAGLSTSTPTRVPENATNDSDVILNVKLLDDNSSVLSAVSPSFLSSAQQSSASTTQLPSTSSLHPTNQAPSVKVKVPGAENSLLRKLNLVPLYGSPALDNAYRIVWAFVGNFIPLLLLLYFNVCLCRQIYSSYKLQKRLGRQHRAGSSSNVLNLTLVAIVVLFFILVAPSEVTLQISHMTSSGDTPLYKNIECVLNLMQTINFSVNFILYCAINPHFRKTLKHMMCWWCVFRHRTRQFSIQFKTSSM